MKRDVLVLSLLATACAQKVGVSSALGYGCWNCADKWNFGCETGLEAMACKCRNMNFMGTVLACISKNGQNGLEMENGFIYVQENCKYNGEKTYTKRELIDMYETARQKLIDSGDLNNVERVYAPVAVDNPTFTENFVFAKHAKYQYTVGNIFGLAMIAYWGVIVSVSTAVNILRHFWPRLLASLTPKFINNIRRVLVLPAAINGMHSQPVRVLKGFAFSAPTRGQMLIILGYFFLNVASVITVTNYENSRHLLRFVGNRSGIVSFIQLPIMLLFACRNNPLILLTGWPYSTFQVYHHWIGRILALQCMLHGICFTWLGYITHSTHFRWKNISNWRYGNAAFIITILTVVTTVSAFRSRHFEAFASLHKLLFVGFVIGIWGHCIDFGQMPWVYISVGLYCTDRLIRIVRTSINGFAIAEFREVPGGNLRATIKYNGHVVPQPGAYIYMRVLKHNMFWQAHPFSVYSHPRSKNLELAIRPSNGATRKIQELVRASDNNLAAFSVLVEGPYGAILPLQNYETVVLIAGGVGVTAMYSHALRQMQRGNKIYFIWVVRNSTFLDWFSEELETLIADKQTSLEIFVTKSLFDDAITFSTSEDTLAEESEMTLAVVEDEFRTVNFRSVKQSFAPFIHQERPDIKNEVARYIAASSGRLAVCSCGPSQFIDGIRASVANNLGATSDRLDYFEEAFGW